jgi:hypothetical protein
MAGYGTLKPGGSYATQLTFPTIFSEVYAKSSMPIQYAPRGEQGRFEMYAGDDEMATYHAQKAMDTHKQILNGVRDTNMARIRSFTSPHGVPDKPQKIMSQRKYGMMTGALQSDGNNSAYSSDNFVRGYDPTPIVNSISGGVLRTKAGQEYAQMLLSRRKKQLDAMGEVQLAPSADSLALNASLMSPTEAFNDSQRLELAQTIDTISETFQTGTTFTQDTTATFLNMIKLVIRFMVSCDLSEANAVREALIDMVEYLGQYSDDAGNNAVLVQSQFLNAGRGGYFLELTKNLLQFVNQMIPAINLPPRDRVLKASALQNALGFTTIVNASTQRVRKRDEGAKSDKERQILETIARHDASSPDGRRAIEQIQRAYNADKSRIRFDRVEQVLNSIFGKEGREAEERRREGQRPGDGRDVLFAPTVRDIYGSRAGVFYGEPIGEAGEPNYGDVGAPFQPLEDVMGAEAVGSQTQGRPASVASELPEGLEREEGEEKEDYKERLRVSIGDEPTKANIEMLQKVKPRLTWGDLAGIFGLGTSTLKNILSGKREEGAKKKSGRKGKK